MANVNNVNSGGNQSAISQIGAEIGQALENFNQGVSGDVSRGLKTVEGSNGGGEGNVEEEQSTSTIPQTSTVMPQNQTRRRPMSIEDSRVFGWADRQRAQDAATMQSQLADMGKTYNTAPSTINPSFTKEAGIQTAPMAVDVSTGNVRQVQNANALENAVDNTLEDSPAVVENAKKSSVKGKKESESSDTGQTTQKKTRKQNKDQGKVKHNVNGYSEQLPIEERKKNETPYEAAERVMNTYEASREYSARKEDQDVYAGYAQFRQDNPLADPSEYIAMQNLSEESFRNLAALPEDNVENDIAEFERMLNETGLRDSPDDEQDFETRKNTEKQDRLISRTVSDFIRGFFHVESERVEELENGIEVLRWSKDVEKAMIKLMRYFNIRGIKGQRTVFRLVRLYASMSVDRQGNMFNEDSNEWSLSDSEFVLICDLILESCREYGHPLGIVRKNAQLRGTQIYPCGVLPKVVASAICNPGSQLQTTPAELVQLCQDQWTTDTLPAMRRNLNGDAISQLIVIQDMARAISMLDGMSAERFSERYNVSTSLDYHLSEYQNRNKEYATAMNNSVDAIAVKEREDSKVRQYRNRYDKQRHFSMVRDHEGIEHGIQNKEKDWISGLKFFNKLTRAGGTALNLPIWGSAFAEKGIGNLRTQIALWAMGSKYEVSDYTSERIRSDESIEAFQCVKELYDAFGPGAVRLFAESGMEYTKENVAKFAQDNLESLTSKPFEVANKMLDKFTHKVLTADYAFRRQDVDLWFQAYLASNKAAADIQQMGPRQMRKKFAEEYNWPIDQVEKHPEFNQWLKENWSSQREIPLTASEIDGMVRSYNTMGQFFTEAMGTDYGINAYNMMKANNIGQVSPLSYSVDRFLRDHAVTDTVITQFVDTYPRYGLNFIYMLTPFSRTMSYIKYKTRQENDMYWDESEIAADVVIGGNYEDFMTGLRMNLIYDAMTLGHNFIIGGVIGFIFYSLGFEPPDDDGNLYNVSMWKIGGKVGLGEDVNGDGKGDGIEIQVAWWMNDLSLLQLPVAYFTATYLSTNDLGLARDLMMDSLRDTIDGNVLLDFADTVKNFRENYVEFNRMIEDDAYKGPKDIYSFATMEFQQYTLSLLMGKKWNPLNPVMNMLNRDTLFAGEQARNRAYNKVFDKSDDWHKENGITKYVDSYDEYLRRKYTSSNLLYAMACNTFINRGDENKTGYFWWEMPARTMGDNLGYAYCSKYAMDYSNIPEGMTTEQYEEEMANKVLADIAGFDGDINKALMQGYTIPKDARKATLNVLFSRRNSLDNEWAARLESGELSNYVDRQPEYVRYKEERDKINTLIFDWLKNDDIPMWSESYEQLLTDYELGYVWKDSGEPPKPAPVTEMFNPAVETVFIPKGNHPTSFLPFTVVDTRDRGWNAETINWWFKEGTSGSDLQAIFDGIGKSPIGLGRDADMILNDSLFGKQPISGEYANRNGATINYRSYVPKKLSLDDEISNFDEKSANGGVLGENGKYSQDAQDIINGKVKTGNGSGYTTYWPRSTYGYSGGGGSYTGNYNPKIYSNPRQVNADRAATMYTKTPQSARTSYLRPSFSTKGSREAYKRQDI